MINYGTLLLLRKHSSFSLAIFINACKFKISKLLINISDLAILTTSHNNNDYQKQWNVFISSQIIFNFIFTVVVLAR